MHSYVILCAESNGCVRLLFAIIFHELSVVAKHMFWTTYVAQNHKEIYISYLHQLANSRRLFVDQAVQSNKKSKNLLIFLQTLFDNSLFYADPT